TPIRNPSFAAEPGTRAGSEHEPPQDEHLLPPFRRRPSVSTAPVISQLLCIVFTLHNPPPPASPRQIRHHISASYAAQRAHNAHLCMFARTAWKRTTPRARMS
ncbi:hypothetical protein B0H12DRAFT_1247045, partial [Mycena haematopus]